MGAIAQVCILGPPDGYVGSAARHSSKSMRPLGRSSTWAPLMLAKPALECGRSSYRLSRFGWGRGYSMRQRRKAVAAATALQGGSLLLSSLSSSTACRFIPALYMTRLPPADWGGLSGLSANSPSSDEEGWRSQRRGGAERWDRGTNHPLDPHPIKATTKVARTCS
jgi:hypothetical protein